MRGYGQFCPVALGAEVFAERWTPLILRELLAGSHPVQRAAARATRHPRALLTQRLGALQRAGLLMWFLRRRIHVERLPAERVTVQFEFRGADKRRFWLVLRRPDVDLCLADPGFDTDLYVTTEVRAFTQVYLGHVGIAHALADGSVTLAGLSDLRRAFGGWIGLSPFASAQPSKFTS
jgi:hypothetical protein